MSVANKLPGGYWRRSPPTIGLIYLHPYRTSLARAAVLGPHCVITWARRLAGDWPRRRGITP